MFPLLFNYRCHIFRECNISKKVHCRNKNSLLKHTFSSPVKCKIKLCLLMFHCSQLSYHIQCIFLNIFSCISLFLLDMTKEHFTNIKHTKTEVIQTRIHRKCIFIYIFKRNFFSTLNKRYRRTFIPLFVCLKGSR